jgi:hypothetical protein
MQAQLEGFEKTSPLIHRTSSFNWNDHVSLESMRVGVQLESTEHIAFTNVWQEQAIQFRSVTSRLNHANRVNYPKSEEFRHRHHFHSEHRTFTSNHKITFNQHFPRLAIHPAETLAHKIARVAESTATSINTVGNCALGPRLTLLKFGLKLPAVVATEQGRILEQSGLFVEVTDPKVGDYGFRHWTQSVIRQHGGVDKGDAFIVSGIGPGGQLYAANDHRFVVPGNGVRYSDTKFLRPTADFYRLYGNAPV